MANFKKTSCQNCTFDFCLSISLLLLGIACIVENLAAYILDPVGLGLAQGIWGGGLFLLTGVQGVLRVLAPSDRCTHDVFWYTGSVSLCVVSLLVAVFVFCSSFWYLVTQQMLAAQSLLVPRLYLSLMVTSAGGFLCSLGLLIFYVIDCCGCCLSHSDEDATSKASGQEKENLV